jgi:hypothetical protein
MADDRGALTREVLTLVALVVLVDGIFIGIYFAAGLTAASGGLKLGYTLLWTMATLAVVLRSLGRIRATRLARRRAAPRG